MYGRPGHPRNCFELLGAALRIAKTRMGAALQLLAAGAEWDPRDHGLDGVVHNLGVLGYRSTAALFRICDAGVVMMMTRHPSYVPLELMASGALVITNRNPDTGWLLADRENCLLADLSARDVADRIQEAAESSSLRRRVTACARELVQASYSNWDAEIDATYRYMLSVA